jgi:hypothetical protein
MSKACPKTECSAPESPRHILEVKIWLAAIKNFDMFSSPGHDDRPRSILEYDLQINVAALCPCLADPILSNRARNTTKNRARNEIKTFAAVTITGSHDKVGWQQQF